MASKIKTPVATIVIIATMPTGPRALHVLYAYAADEVVAKTERAREIAETLAAKYERPVRIDATATDEGPVTVGAYGTEFYAATVA